MRIPSTSARSRALAAALTALAAVYLVQLASPLRLDTDSASYLQIATSIADRNGKHPTGTPSFPPRLAGIRPALEVLHRYDPDPPGGRQRAFDRKPVGDGRMPVPDAPPA